MDYYRHAGRGRGEGSSLWIRVTAPLTRVSLRTVIGASNKKVIGCHEKS